MPPILIGHLPVLSFVEAPCPAAFPLPSPFPLPPPVTLPPPPPPQVKSELAIVEHTNQAVTSLARVDFHPACEAAINEQIKWVGSRRASWFPGTGHGCGCAHMGRTEGRGALP